jgi:hypothetical protein
VPSGPSDDFASPTSPPPNSEGPLTLNDADLEYLKRLNANRSQASAFDTNAPAAASPIPPEGPLTLNDAYLECLKRLNANRSQASAFDTNAPAAASPIPSEGPLTLNDAYLEYLKRLNANRSQASAVGTGVPAAPLVPSDDSSFSGGLLGRLTALMAIDPQNPERLALPLQDDDLRSFCGDDPSSRGRFNGGARRAILGRRLATFSARSADCSYATLKNRLPCRANHRHNSIVARKEPAPGTAAGFSFLIS